MLGGSQLPENPASEDLVPSGGLCGDPCEYTYTPLSHILTDAKLKTNYIFVQSRK